MEHPFTDEELLIIFESTRVALADCEIEERIGEALDVSVDEMIRIADKVGDFMGTPLCVDPVAYDGEELEEI